MFGSTLLGFLSMCCHPNPKIMSLMCSAFYTKYIYFSKNKSAYAGIVEKLINKLNHSCALIHMIMCKGHLFFVWKIRATFFLSTVSPSATVHSSFHHQYAPSISDINMLSTEICVVDSWIYIRCIDYLYRSTVCFNKNSFLLRVIALVH